MAKTPPVSYGGLALATKPVAQPVDATSPSGEVRFEARKRPMESKAEPTLIYMSRDAKIALKQYIVNQLEVKVHDILVEALQDWCDRKGLDVKVRVPTDRKRRVR